MVSEANFLLSDIPSGRQCLLELPKQEAVRFPFSYAGHTKCMYDPVRTYADRPMSLVDACLVCMSEIHEASRVFTVDSDFRVYHRHGDEAIPVSAPGR